MAKYKITKTDEYYTYELPAHNECKLTRLHDPADVEGGKLILSRSHFLPAGGGFQYQCSRVYLLCGKRKTALQRRGWSGNLA